MADLLAIISHHRAEPVAPAALDALSATYESLRGPASSQKTASTSWAGVRVLDHPSPAAVGIGRSGAGWTAWAGPLADPATASTAALGELDGQFALARLGDDGSTLQVATDPLGMKPLFVAQDGERTYVASSALVLAKHLRSTPSRRGLETFLRIGSQFGRDTPWEGIRRLGPAQALTFMPERQRTDTYWQPAIDEAVRRLSFRQCADACIEEAAAAFERRYRGTRHWVDLTGGFDTRLLALLVRRAGIDFVANTSGDDDSEDVELARRIAGTADWPWRHFVLPGDWEGQLPARVDEAVAWGDGHLDALPLAEVMLGHRQKSEAGVSLLNGGGGEHYRDYPWGQELLAAGRSSSVNFDRLLAWRVLGPIDLSVFREDPTAAIASDLRTELERRVEPFSSLSNTVQCDLLYAFKATGHFGAYQATAGASVHMELPFYLKPVFTSAISASPRHRNYHRLMREMMRRLDPVIAAIPTETGGPAEPLGIRNLHRFAPYPWRRGKRFVARVRGRLPELGGHRNQLTPRDAARGALIAQLRREGRLNPAQMRSACLYDRERLTALLESAAAAPGSVDWTTVGRIATVELALEAVDAALD